MLLRWTVRLLLPAALAAAALADPAPLPPNPQILALVQQISPDSLRATVEGLVAFHTRHTYSDTLSPTVGIGAARNWLLGRFGQAGLPAGYFYWNGNWGGGPWPCRNVHGNLPGSSGPGRVVVMGGHMDSRTVSSGDVTGFAPGADDDGSGVAALVETGRLLCGQTLRTTFVPAAFAGEEQGLLGAEAYVDQLQVGSVQVAGMINLDMIGHIVHPGGAVDSVTVRCFSGGPMESSSRQLARYLKWAGEAYSGGLAVLLQPALDRPGRSGDHIPFYNAGWPAVRLIETAEDVAYQHGSLDVPENMSFSYAARVTRLAAGVAALLTLAPDPPPAPAVVNGGDGQSLLVSWPDTLPPPGGCMRLAWREAGQLYWEDVITFTSSPPCTLSGLTAGVTYALSLSAADSLGRPSPFGPEILAAPLAAPPPEGFETTSDPQGVDLRWQPRPEPAALDYRVERAPAGGTFQQVAVLPHPDSTWRDTALQPGVLYWYQVRTHTNQGLTGFPSPVQEGRLATHDQGILVVDATPDGGGLPSPPGDAEVDAFYQDYLAPFAVAGQWDRADSLAAGVTLSDADLAPHSIVLLHADHFSANFSADTTALRKYVQAGGKLLLCGWRLSFGAMQLSALAHHLEPGDFLYDLAGIDSVQVSPPPAALCGTAGAGGYPDLVFDALRFPVMGGALFYGEACWNASFPPDVTVIGAFQALAGTGSPFHGRPLALRGGGAAADWVLLDAPLFCMTPASADSFLTRALEDLQAPPSGFPMPPPELHPSSFALHPFRPNPFNPVTVARYEIRDAGHVDLRVYDTAGREVAALVDGWKAAGTHSVTFDASGLPSGIYLARLEAGDFSQVQKLVLLK